MCGISGFVTNTKNNQLINNFITDLEHRGPDNKNYLIIKAGKSYVHLGSTRLAIRGDSKENMPMKHASGNVLTYNGEVFDINKLHSDLGNNKNYEGDTRMLLDLLSQDIRHIDKVNGMFAFAFFNNKNQKLYLGRDLLGIKPLYYFQNKNNEIYFSSEIKCLINNLDHDFSIKNENLINLFLLNGFRDSSSFIENIKTVLPGEILEIDITENNNIKKNNFGKLENFKSSEHDFENLMMNVVNDHLSADTSVDLFLSGGIDSSILSYLIRNKLSKNVRHFSMTFENQSYDESDSIKRIANELNLESKIFKFNSNQVDQYVTESLDNMNSLVLDYSFVPTYLLSKNTSQYTKAVLSGDGADEVFGGYEWYRGIKFLNFMPNSIRKLLSTIINRIDLNKTSTNNLSYREKAFVFFKHFSKDPYIQMMIWQSSYQNFDDKKTSQLAVEINKIINKNMSKNEKIREIDLNYYLNTNVLQKVDVASMANSLEVRPPYLDYRILNYTKNNKNTSSVGLFNTKLFLRKYLDKTELNFLNENRKQGFGFPVTTWMNNYGVEELKQMYSDNSLIYLSEDKKYIEKLLYKDNQSLSDYRELWTYYVTSKWMRQNNVKLI
tara:strand:- start:426 stop:2249 length:1824 start_codon:yes stop_codon:yes gene_type:complete